MGRNIGVGCWGDYDFVRGDGFNCLAGRIDFHIEIKKRWHHLIVADPQGVPTKKNNCPIRGCANIAYPPLFVRGKVFSP